MFFGAREQKTAQLGSKPRRQTNNHLLSSIAKKSTRDVSVFCRDQTFVFVLNYRLTTGTKKTGMKKTGKKACSSPHTIGKQLYSSENASYRLEDTLCLKSPSIVADMSVFSVRLDIYVCTKLSANSREEENRDDRPSHFVSFSYYFKWPSCCIQPCYKRNSSTIAVTHSSFASRRRKAPWSIVE